MSAPGETSTGSERPCGLSSLIPLGMSCRGRAEAFARRLQSRLRTLGSQGSVTQANHVDSEQSENSWLTQNEQQVTSLQPLRNLSHEADSFFDFDLEPESPGSPIDECEYSRLIETATTTPQPCDVAPESGYICASPISAEGSVESQSSSDGPYFDPETSDNDQKSLGSDYYDCIEALKKETSVTSLSKPKTSSPSGSPLANGHLHTIMDSDVDSSESLPPSQTTTTSETTPTINTATKSSLDSNSTATGLSSVSNSTLHDETEPESDLLGARDNDDEDVIPTVQERESQCKEQAEQICEALTNLEQNRITNGETTQEEEIERELDDDNTSRPDEQKKHSETNGHLPNGNPYNEDEFVNSSTEHEENGEQIREEELEQSNEKIILDCLHIIDATPEASPEPEVRTPTEEPQSPGHLKVEDGDGDRPQRVRRCSSLKTGKTPPGTPGRKKIVRFADVLGLDLADVRTFMDDVPKIPKSAFEDLELTPEQPSMSLGPRVEKVLVPLFQQPSALSGFLDMVRDRQVCLENAAVTDPISLTITGSVRVRNLDFHKSVYLRYSTDSWRSYADLQGNYVENSCDGFSDKFTFILYGNALQVGQRIELAVRFHCKGQIFWDNNYGANYCFQCLPVSAPVRPSRPPDVQSLEDSWAGASFY